MDYYTEAICTGSLAGHNAVRQFMGLPLLILPRNLAIGDIIAYANEKTLKEEDRKSRYTFAGSVYFKRMQEKGLYITDKNIIEDKINKLNLNNILAIKLT
ncbi:folate-dependent tRNA-U54 methylase TrmFO/GidA [Eubacterium multiforme]|uniref:Folate-dependent tRNA-U54 methylase TrmFO/GidA n=1 Tax=Eubacterium multiforme TaxID=83339 RepID=A0ABT9URQ9_9FIRM|nr:folate-dependent tRNA-U54 methylase TrmFO/GidA [Eubacterium multiforme]